MNDQPPNSHESGYHSIVAAGGINEQMSHSRQREATSQVSACPDGLDSPGFTEFALYAAL